MRPLSHSTISALQQKGFTKRDPILLRIFKQESELEVWKKSSKNGQFRKFKSYEICRWSGKLGPKFQEGDRQAPEGFYEVTPALMNPNSSYHLSFNLGFPNAFDQAHDRTGTHLMVHGACSSAGCYAMEDEQIEEIYALAREAFRGGQKAFQVQAFPFRMTPENMAMNAASEHMSFWRMLKEGHDHFEVTRRAPKVDVCERRYVFNAETGEFDPTGPCPELEVPESIQVAVADKQAEDQAEERIVLAKLEEQRIKEEENLAREQAIMVARAEAEAERAGPVALTPASAPIVKATDAVRDGLERLNPFRRPAAPVPVTTPPSPAETAQDAVTAAIGDTGDQPISVPVLSYVP